MTHFQAALKRAPNDATLHYDLGLALKLKDQLADAMVEFRKAEDLDPAQPDVHYTLGVTLWQKGDFDESVKELHAQRVMDVRLRRVEVLCLAKFNHGIGELVFEFERQAQVVVQGRIVRRALESRLEVRHRALEVGLLQISRPEIGLVAGIVGVQAQGSLKFGHRACGLSRLDESKSKIVVRVGIVGVEFSSPPQGGDGLFHSTLALQ